VEKYTLLGRKTHKFMIHLSTILELFSKQSMVNDHFLLSSKKCFSVLQLTSSSLVKVTINSSQPCTLVKLQVLYCHHLSKHCAPINSMPLLPMAIFKKTAARPSQFHCSRSTDYNSNY